MGGSESEAESASSSQESATSVAFFLLVFTSAEAFGLVCVGRVMSLIAGPLSLRDSWRREDWSSESFEDDSTIVAMYVLMSGIQCLSWLRICSTRMFMASVERKRDLNPARIWSVVLWMAIHDSAVLGGQNI